MSEQQREELEALVAWLLTFPQFSLVFNDDDVANGTWWGDSTVVKAILLVAEDVCRDGSCTSSDRDLASSTVTPDTECYVIWEHILGLVKTEGPRHPVDRLDPEQLRHWVIAGMLDCAVSNQSVEQRRVFVERIMSLPTETQHTLMTIIERGKSAHTSEERQDSKSVKPESDSNQKRHCLTPKHSMHTSRSTPRNAKDGSTPHSTGQKTTTKMKILRSPIFNCVNKAQALQDGKDSVRSETPGKYISRRSLDEAFATPGYPGYTPDRKKSSVGKPMSARLRNISPGLPIDEALHNNLRQQNELLETELKQYRQRESDLYKRMEEAEAQFRKDMMKLESASHEREEIVKRNHEKEMRRLQEEQKALKERSKRADSALEELALMRDEMEVMRHSKEQLLETTEKLRICKERLEQLEDVKEQLKREELAHASSVEQCLQLENELQTLQPLRRQLAEYKERALEAEIRLTDCQDELNKLKESHEELVGIKSDLLKGVRDQQEEANELRTRLSQDESCLSGPAVGEGISELNPEVKDEMARLRSENARLSAFAAKREDDAVQKLEEKLEDYESLAERFKDQYLGTKKQLETKEMELGQSAEREVALTEELDKLSDKVGSLETYINELEEALDACKQELAETHDQLAESQQEQDRLNRDLEEWVTKAEDAESISKSRLELLQGTRNDLESTRSQLSVSNKKQDELRESIEVWMQNATEADNLAKELKTELTDTRQQLEKTTEDLEESKGHARTLADEISELKTQNTSLEQDLASEVEAKKKLMEEAERTLDDTIETLEINSRKEIEELQTNMNTLLEDERKARRHAAQKAETELKQLEEKHRKEYFELQERSTSALKASRQERQERIEYIQEEHNKEVKAMKEEAEQEKEKLIEKGKRMIKEIKEKARADIDSLVDQQEALHHALDMVRSEKEDAEKLYQAKTTAYKQKLQHATIRVRELNRDGDELRDSIGVLENDKFKLQEENDKYRRQLGGRFGVDGKLQKQLETLQKEFSQVVEENREMRKQLSSQRPGSDVLRAIPEFSEGSDGDHAPAPAPSYSRGMSQSTLSQLRSEYEETIASLNDEKRELVMKNSAAITDVQKAEQRAWASDQEVARLKTVVTSLRLALERAGVDNYSASVATTVSCGDLSADENVLPADESIFSAQEDDSQRMKVLPGLDTSGSQPATVTRSGSQPATVTRIVLSPSKHHKNASNVFNENTTEKIVEVSQASSGQERQQTRSIEDYTQVGGPEAADGKPECNQS